MRKRLNSPPPGRFNGHTRQNYHDHDRKTSETRSDNGCDNPDSYGTKAEAKHSDVGWGTKYEFIGWYTEVLPTLLQH
jgi:hypothetical protein